MLQAGDLRENINITRYDAVAQETLGIDRIEPKLSAQFLAQFADMVSTTFSSTSLSKMPVNRTKNLHLVETTAAIGNQIFQNAALKARERKIDTVDLRIAAIGENTDRPQLRAICARGCRCARTAADRIDARENFADMNGLAHHIVNPG
ncbi:Uncharacterised protein [Brucella melitensis]|nr:Uncharacterised protein [Brucella melitensis]